MEAIAERFASSGRLAAAQRGEEHQPHNARSCLSPFSWPNHPLGEPPTLLLALGVEVSHAGPQIHAIAFEHGLAQPAMDHAEELDCEVRSEGRRRGCDERIAGQGA